MGKPELCVGITTYNSATFLPYCLESLRAKTQGVTLRILVVDNKSVDRSVSIAREHGAEVIVQWISQVDAMNLLLARSKARFTLLIHSDVIFLSDLWFSLCREQMKGSCALVSPEDVSGIPHFHNFPGMPQSSF